MRTAYKNAEHDPELQEIIADWAALDGEDWEMSEITLKRVYDPVSKTDGTRILVERLWPRGLKKEELHMDLWLKEIAPSPALRKWFSHDLAKWKEFQKKYIHELEENQKALKVLKSKLCEGPVTLLYSSRDQEHNSALCLKNYLLA